MARTKLPSADAALDGATLMALNARSLRRSGHLLAEAQLYGPAVGMLILGCEEAVKATVLTAWGYGMPVKRDDLGAMLRNHVTRHGAVIMILTMTPIFGPTISALVSDLPDVENILALRDEFVGHFVDMADEIVAQLPAFEESLNGNLDAVWWADASQTKNRGFYVDQDGLKWVAPAAVTEQAYEDALKRANYVFDDVLPFVEEWLGYNRAAAAQMRTLASEIQDELSAILDQRYKEVKRIT